LGMGGLVVCGVWVVWNVVVWNGRFGFHLSGDL